MRKGAGASIVETAGIPEFLPELTGSNHLSVRVSRRNISRHYLRKRIDVTDGIHNTVYLLSRHVRNYGVPMAGKQKEVKKNDNLNSFPHPVKLFNSLGSHFISSN